MRANTTSRPNTLIAASAALLLALASCGGGGGDVVVAVDPAMVTMPTISGHLVLYTAETDFNTAVGPDELWAADTGSATQVVTRLDRGLVDDERLYSPFALGTSGAVGYWVDTNAVGCDQELRLFPRHGGMTSAPLSGICLLKFQASADGQRLAYINYTGSGGGPAATHVTTANASTDVTLTLAPDDFELSGDGHVMYWLDGIGAWALRSANITGSITALTPQLVSSTYTYKLLPTRDGSAVVYYKSGQDGLFIATQNGSSDTRLIAQLAPTAFVSEAALSPDGAYALYVVHAGPSDDQLWFVPLNAPLTEQRVDSVATHYAGDSFSIGKFAVSPDGARIAWLGDAGSGVQIFVASTATPTASTAVTPTTTAASLLRWTNATTLAYASTQTGAGSALRTVSVNAPLTTVLLGTAEATGDLGNVALCSDGTLVFDQRGHTDGTTRLLKATPMNAASVVQISPTYVNVNYAFTELVCVD